MEPVIGSVSLLAFVFVYVTAYGIGIGHLAMAAWRRLRGQDWTWDVWLVAMFVPIPVLILVGLGASLFLTDAAGEMNDTGTQLIVITTTLLLVMPPIVVMLIRNDHQGHFGWLGYIYALAGITALPMGMVLVTVGLIAPTLAESGGTASLLSPGYFVVDTEVPACTRTMIDGLSFSRPTREELSQIATGPASRQGPANPTGAMLTIGISGREINSGDLELNLITQFWIDATLKAVFLDAFEVFGCGVTTVKNDPDNVLLSTTVFAYRTFAAAIVLAIVIGPFVRNRNERR